MLPGKDCWMRLFSDFRTPGHSPMTEEVRTTTQMPLSTIADVSLCWRPKRLSEPLWTTHLLVWQFGFASYIELYSVNRTSLLWLCTTERDGVFTGHDRAISFFIHLAQHTRVNSQADVS